MTHVLIAGVSTRAAAESAARAGFAVTAVDAFADLDQHPDVRALSLPRDCGLRFSATAAARVARSIAADAIAYLSPFENHPRAIQRMASGRTLLGNPPSVLCRVRDPLVVAEVLTRHGFAVPRVRTTAANVPDGPEAVWLVKPRASGGGRGVKPWRARTAVPRRSILQEHITGTPGSIVFVAARGKAVAIALSRQLIGLPEFGASGYRYCGSIMSSASDPQFEREARLVEAARQMTAIVANDFGLVGVNGIDFVADEGVPFAIEVNPRWSASIELVERDHNGSVFAAHVSACTDGPLPSPDLLSTRREHGGAVGKAIVFARRDAVIGDTRPWLIDPDIHDVPRLGDRVRCGEPVCTVFARGATAQECEAALGSRARDLYARLDRWADDSRTARGRRVASAG